MMKKIVLIIGNGFDLDLGFKTSYNDFIKTGVLRKYINPLIRKLLQQHSIQSWIDIEEFLKEHASQDKYAYDEKTILEGYLILRDELLKYIKSLTYDNINANNTALMLLSAVLQYSSVQIFSFNYTDLNTICQVYGISCRAHITHIHGKSADNSIILGFDDDTNIKKNAYSCMIKSHSAYYRSANINKALLNADEIIFFGHSLGSTDYHYFRHFFMSRVQENCISDDQLKKIRIFTFDEQARQRILLQIRNMNDRKTNMLYDLNDFRIFRTQEDREEIALYCQDLSNKSIRDGRSNTQQKRNNNYWL